MTNIVNYIKQNWKTIIQLIKRLINIIKPNNFKHNQQIKIKQNPAKPQIYFQRKKPDWVKQKVIYLSAHLPHKGCRTIANHFNRIYSKGTKKQPPMTIGKTYVANIIQKEHYKILLMRRTIKNRAPKRYRKNHCWGLDLTFYQGETIMGTIDHGTRFIPCLQTLPNKSTLTIIKTLINVFERVGMPKTIRTDNEALFTSRLFTSILWIIGVKHQRTERYSPWQNGRIERFFGTLKSYLQQIEIPSNKLNQRLQEFCFYYHHVRPHQNLNNQTPIEVWYHDTEHHDAGHKNKYHYQKQSWFSAWEGVLAGVIRHN